MTENLKAMTGALKMTYEAMEKPRILEWKDQCQRMNTGRFCHLPKGHTGEHEAVASYKNRLPIYVRWMSSEEESTTGVSKKEA